MYVYVHSVSLFILILRSVLPDDVRVRCGIYSVCPCAQLIWFRLEDNAGTQRDQSTDDADENRSKPSVNKPDKLSKLYTGYPRYIKDVFTIDDIREAYAGLEEWPRPQWHRLQRVKDDPMVCGLFCMLMAGSICASVHGMSIGRKYVILRVFSQRDGVHSLYSEGEGLFRSQLR